MYMIRRVHCCFWICLIVQLCWSQPKRVVVKEAASGVLISGCTVSYLKQGQKESVITDEHGACWLDTDNDALVTFTHVSYNSVTLDVAHIRDSVVYLRKKQVALDTVMVYSPWDAGMRQGGNLFKYQIEDVSAQVSIIGERDVLRHISIFPGVSAGVEGSLALFVRGGNGGGNGIFFNDVPMYISSHAMGLVSTFPASVVDDVQFYMGGLSATKGNQSSSLLDVSVRRVYGEKLSSKISLSPYLLEGYVAAPLKKDKVSLQLSGRSSLLPTVVNFFIKNIDSDSQKEIPDIKLHDFTAVLDYRISNRHTLDGMFFSTSDVVHHLLPDSEYTQKWHASSGKVGWQWRRSPSLKGYTYGYYTDVAFVQEYTYKQFSSKELSYLLSSKLREWKLHSQLEYSPVAGVKSVAGVSQQSQVFSPNNEHSSRYTALRFNRERYTSYLTSVFGEISYLWNNRADITLGGRYTLQRILGGANSYVDIHLRGRYHVSDKWGVECAYDRLYQHYHVLEGLPVGWSLNVMVPAMDDFPSEMGNQYFSGLFWKDNFRGLRLNASWGFYYKKMNNLVSYISGINVFNTSGVTWQHDVDLGEGTSVGTELSVRAGGTLGSFSLGYTLSKTDRRFANINKGESFPFKFDRRHMLSVMGDIVPVRTITSGGSVVSHIFNAVVSYSSGNRITLPVSGYQGIAPPFWNLAPSGNTFPIDFYNHIYDREELSSSNKFRVKDYFRVDVGYLLRRKRPRGRETEFGVSVFNVLNRHNPYTYFREEGQWKQLTIIPLIPSLRWSMSW